MSDSLDILLITKVQSHKWCDSTPFHSVPCVRIEPDLMGSEFLLQKNTCLVLAVNGGVWIAGMKLMHSKKGSGRGILKVLKSFLPSGTESKGKGLIQICCLLSWVLSDDELEQKVFYYCPKSLWDNQKANKFVVDAGLLRCNAVWASR